MNIGGSFTAANFYLMNTGTLNLNTGGNLNGTAVRLGGDFATTGTQNLALGATFNLTPATGGLTFAGVVNSVASNTSGALVVNSQNTSGTNTLSNQIALDSALKITQSAGGTLAITQVKGGDNTTGTDLKGNTLTFTPAATGAINHSGTIYNSTGTGSVTMNGAGTLRARGIRRIGLHRAAQVEAAARLVIGEGAGGAEAVFFGNEWIGGEKAAQLRQRTRVQRGPLRVGVPMARKVVGRAQMPAGRARGVEDFAAMRKGARRQRDLLARVVKLRIVRHALHEIPAREKEMPRHENARRGRGLVRRFEERRFHVHDPIRIEMGKRQPRPGERRKRLAAIRPLKKPRQIRREDRILRRAALQLCDQKFIPARDEPVMRIELQIKLLPIIPLLNARPRPARPLACRRRDALMPHADSRRPRVGGRRLVVLLENREHERLGSRRLRRQIAHRAHQIGIAIRRDGDENAHALMETDRPGDGKRGLRERAPRFWKGVAGC